MLLAWDEDVADGPCEKEVEDGGGVPIKLARTADVLAAGPDPGKISDPRRTPPFVPL